MSQVFDVIIVGAGISGLNAAYSIIKKRPDTKLLVVEARPRIGGRTFTTDSNYDLGATWVWPSSNPNLIKLIKELDIHLIKQFNNGKSIEEHRTSIGVRMERSSSERMRIRDGAQQICEKLLQKITDGTENDVLRLSTVVQEVDIAEEVNSKTVIVKCTSERGDEIFFARHVILAVPPLVILKHIQLNGKLALSRDRIQSMSETPTWMATATKVLVTYDRPFWREKGFSGSAGSFVGPVANLWDSCYESQNMITPALCGFVNGRIAERLLNGEIEEHAFKSAVLRQLVRFYGEEAEYPTGFKHMNWTGEKWTCHDPKSPISQDHMMGQDCIRDIVAQVLHFASTETEEVNGGYMEGAVTSGYRVACEVLERLNSI
jgi:monoamine oxidase